MPVRLRNTTLSHDRHIGQPLSSAIFRHFRLNRAERA